MKQEIVQMMTVGGGSNSDVDRAGTGKRNWMVLLTLSSAATRCERLSGVPRTVLRVWPGMLVFLPWSRFGSVRLIRVLDLLFSLMSVALITGICLEFFMIYFALMRR